jgi:hypothetical protein
VGLCGHLDGGWAEFGTRAEVPHAAQRRQWNARQGRDLPRVLGRFAANRVCQREKSGAGADRCEKPASREPRVHRRDPSPGTLRPAHDSLVAPDTSLRPARGHSQPLFHDSGVRHIRTCGVLFRQRGPPTVALCSIPACTMQSPDAPSYRSRPERPLHSPSSTIHREFIPLSSRPALIPGSCEMGPGIEDDTRCPTVREVLWRSLLGANPKEARWSL